MRPEELRARAADQAGRIGVPLPPVMVGDTPGGTVDVCLVRRDGSWILMVDPQVMRLPGPVVDGYLAHPLVGASLRQHVGRRRLRLAIVLCMIAVEVWLLVTGVPPWWVLLLTVPTAGLLVGVVDMLAIRRNLLAADRRAAALFGPAFMVPALEFMQANPPTVKGLVRLLMKGLPTPSQRLARLGHGPATPAGAHRSRPD